MDHVHSRICILLVLLHMLKFDYSCSIACAYSEKQHGTRSDPCAKKLTHSHGQVAVSIQNQGGSKPPEHTKMCSAT